MKFPMLKKSLSNVFKSSYTENYPEVPRETPKNFRGKISLDKEKCIGCGMCVRTCPAEGVTKRVEDEHVIIEFNLGSCTFCSLCADMCPKGAITLTNEFSVVAENEEELIVGGIVK